MLSQSAGSPAVGAINPNGGNIGGGNTFPNSNVFDIASNREAVQVIGQTAGGQLQATYFDSGYAGDASTQGQLFATNLMGGSFTGFNIVNAGVVAHTDLFPIS